MNVSFATDFKAWLESHRWTPTSLAERLNVQRQSVHNWIDGKSFPKNETIIFQLLELGGEQLLQFDENDKLPRKFADLMKAQQQAEYFEIQGGQKLSGEVFIPGAKNAALPMLCASLLTKETCTFTNVPEITDIGLLLKIFERLGAAVEWNKAEKIVHVTAKNIDPSKLGESPEVRKFRASILLLGPLLARCGEAAVFRPGGCVLGARPNDVHLNGFESFGAEVTETDDAINLKFPRKKFVRSTVHTDDPVRVLLPEASVTATENLAIFAAGVEDDAEIFFTACETHVTATLEMLQQMGADIHGIRTHRLKIRGKSCDQLRGGTFQIPPDGLLAGTYALAGILTDGDLTIRNVYHTELLSFYGLLKRTGANFSFAGDTLTVSGKQKLKSVPKLQTAIYPGFSTDLQSPFGVLLTQCVGESMIFETLFENRLTYLSELEKMGAQVELMNSHQAKIRGKTELRGTEVQSWDLRAGAAMVLAGLIAKGTTKVTNINYIDRGYENFDTTLQNLGAKITRKNSLLSN